ncbi:hypothetical protein EDD86DRAFT_83830 [Gorgonomyces haynaldii]|nr:hypothetical protein EDD86DRAFT_83830 [Gorgonomyces haynaldii]
MILRAIIWLGATQYLARDDRFKFLIMVMGLNKRFPALVVCVLLVTVAILIGSVTMSSASSNSTSLAVNATDTASATTAATSKIEPTSTIATFSSFLPTTVTEFKPTVITQVVTKPSDGSSNLAQSSAPVPSDTVQLLPTQTTVIVTPQVTPVDQPRSDASQTLSPGATASIVLLAVALVIAIALLIRRRKPQPSTDLENIPMPPLAKRFSFEDQYKFLSQSRPPQMELPPVPQVSNSPMWPPAVTTSPLWRPRSLLSNDNRQSAHLDVELNTAHKTLSPLHPTPETSHVGEIDENHSPQELMEQLSHELDRLDVPSDIMSPYSHRSSFAASVYDDSYVQNTVSTIEHNTLSTGQSNEKSALSLEIERKLTLNTDIVTRQDTKDSDRTVRQVPLDKHRSTTTVTNVTYSQYRYSDVYSEINLETSPTMSKPKRNSMWSLGSQKTTDADLDDNPSLERIKKSRSYGSMRKNPQANHTKRPSSLSQSQFSITDYMWKSEVSRATAESIEEVQE